MTVYIYEADIYCEACGKAIRADLAVRDTGMLGMPTPETPETEYDSDDYPKGPYSGGEADCPQHCGGCGVFLENPLTSDGYDYVRESGNREWADYYEVDLVEEEADLILE